MTNKHIAFQLPFQKLRTGLMERVEQGLVSRKVNEELGLELYTYTQECTFSKAWDVYTLSARGLILSPVAEMIVAVPFSKFFNYGEMDSGPTPITEDFEVFEKMDGSLIIAYFWQNKWRFATKGSFNSDQAIWAQEWAYKNLDIYSMNIDYTYLFEATYPENRIVIKYEVPQLVLLSIYNTINGEELETDQVEYEADNIHSPLVHCYPGVESLRDLVEAADVLPSDHEGWVIRFKSGHRLKIKGAEYLRLHRMVSNLNPLSIWELMRDGFDPDSYKKELPEEFWVDFDAIHNLLKEKLDFLLDSIEFGNKISNKYSDKDLGLSKVIPKDIKSYLFAIRKGEDILKIGSKIRKHLYDTFRPTANKLEGYVPSRSTINAQRELTA